MRTITILMIALVLVASPAFATTWEVDYILRSELGETTTFYGPGTYAFLLNTDDTTTVYILEGNWNFLGYYRTISLPSDLPPISFPVGTNAAAAFVVDDPPGLSVAEPATLWLVLVAAAVILMMLHTDRRNDGVGTLIPMTSDERSDLAVLTVQIGSARCKGQKMARACPQTLLTTIR